MQINKKINYIYEFKTPNGYLPIGTEYRALPIIFDHINELEYQHGTSAHRMGYSNGFRILNECASTYDVLTLGQMDIPSKMLYSLTDDEESVYLLPSFGSQVNQTNQECFSNIGTQKEDLRSNPSVHNGSTRLFWKAPNYGYFDNAAITKPEPDEYIREVYNKQEEQQNFGLYGSVNKYTKISELFTTFSPEILDKFEEQFLLFSKSIYDFESNLSPRKEDTSIEVRNENFQGLMREMFKIPLTKDLTGSALIEKLTNDQKNNVQKVIDEFMNYMVVFKYGNPSNFDKKLFYTFSTDFIEDPYTWQGYVQNSPDALPYQGGGVTLAQSKFQYPETWAALETYVGFSEIPELVYSDYGSYITDFFVEMDVEFSINNIKLYAPIIKLYATQKLINFNNYDNNQSIVQQPPIPNPNSQLPPQPTQSGPSQFNSNPQTATDLEVWEPTDKFILQNTFYIITYKKDTFTVGALFDSANTLVSIGQSTSVSSVTPLQIAQQIIISTYGSVSTVETDPQFITQSLVLLYFVETTTTTQTPIQQLFNQPVYEKEFNNGSNMSKFFNLMNDYISNGESYLNVILDDTLIKTRAKLGNVNVTTENTGIKYTEFNGEQTRLEIWDTLKSINDKWISGGDFKTKTLFEDVLLMDRASRDIGQKIFVDIFKLKDLIEFMDYKNFFLGVVNTIFTDNRFTPFILPSYVNFYNIQDASKNPTPRPEGTLEFANSLFGTFLSVDYRDTTAKYLGIYAYVPSSHLALNENADYRYRDDAFDLRRASDNPLIENQDGKNDWDKSNKVVGFNVDFGPQNQQIFKQLDIAQDPGKPTAESEQMLTQMANVYRNRGGSSQSVSLYNIYRNRSYRCSIDMLGNALIQPTMYFNLRNVPLFSGPYMITDVTHRISENGFDTSFEGQRQPFYSIPAIDTLLQSLTSKILETIQEKIEQQDKEIQESNNILAQKSDIINRINSEKNVLTANQNCQANLNSSFTEYTNTTPTKTSISFADALSLMETKVLKTTLSNTNKEKLLDFMFATMYVESGEGKKFVTNDYNYASVNLNVNPWGGSSTYLNKKYYCVNRGGTQNIPVASFDGFEKFIDFFIAKFKDKVTAIENYSYNDTTYKQKLAKANVLLWPQTLTDETVWTNLAEQEKTKLQNKIAVAIDYISEIKGRFD